ncbi:MAG: TolC family protein [Hyphomicrobiaceae bacterium]|nr:TolC family protein [Hyphomicrobiaceae bacterium]
MLRTSTVATQLRHDIATASLPTSRPLTVYDAVARMLIFNQQLKAEAMARMLAEADRTLANVDMLPQFVASSQVYARSNQPASSSASLANPAITGGYSISSERVSQSRELAFSWNILDFGVSYFRSRQAAHRALIAAEQERRAAQNLIEETRVVFWRALALQTLDEGLRRLDADMTRSIDNAGRLRAAGLTDPVEALASERDLLGIRRDLDQQRKLLVGAEQQLRALINYPPDAPLPLSRIAEPLPPSANRMSFAEIANAALNNRPEIHQAVAEQRITAEEARIAFLELFPNLTLAVGDTLDQNPFLLHQGWLSAASRVSWQLTKVLQYPARSAAMERKAELERQRTRALAVAIILQAQVSLSRLDQSQRELRTLVQMARVQRQLTTQVENQQSVGRAGLLAATRERMNLLLAEARRDAAYGDVQGSYANVLTSFGLDLIDRAGTAGQTPDALAARLRQAEAEAFARAPDLIRLADATPVAGEARR